MLAYRNLLLVGVVLLGCSIPIEARAQGASDTERQKAKLVSRLYQATHGAQKRCGTSLSAKSHRETLERFRSTYPELILLIDSSPYFAAARDHFQMLLDKNALPQLSDEGSRNECQELESILRSLVDAPRGAEAVAGYVGLLKK